MPEESAAPQCLEDKHLWHVLQLVAWVPRSGDVGPAAGKEDGGTL